MRWLCGVSKEGSGPSLQSHKRASADVRTGGAAVGARVPLAPSEEVTTQGSAQRVPKCTAWAGCGLRRSAELQSSNTTEEPLGQISPVSQGCFESRASWEEPGWLLEAISRGPGSLPALPTSGSLTQRTQSTERFCSLAQKMGPPSAPHLARSTLPTHPSRALLFSPRYFCINTRAKRRKTQLS